MRFMEVLAQVVGWLVLERRISYRALKRHFGLDDALIEDLKFEIIDVRRLAKDQDGQVLIWVGDELGSHAVTTAGPISESQLADAASAVLTPESNPVDAALTAPKPEVQPRELTVVFCDLSDSTDLSGRLDPEDLAEVVRVYQEAAAEVVRRFDGYVAQYLGDGLLVYFGYPLAREDDAQRAVYAALGIVEAMDDLNAGLSADYDVELAVRFGIHTGPVVMGEMVGGGRHEDLALGETPHIATRLEDLAKPGAVVISSVTAQLVERAFALEALGPHQLEGVAEPMSLSRVVAPRKAVLAVEEMSSDSSEALVGRDEEVR